MSLKSTFIFPSPEAVFFFLIVSGFIKEACQFNAITLSLEADTYPTF